MQGMSGNAIMKFLKFAAASLMMLGFSSAFADTYEGFFYNGYHYSVEITRLGDGTYRLDYGDSSGAYDITKCTASGKLKGDRIVLTSVRNCKNIVIDPDTKEENVRSYTQSDKLEYGPDADNGIIEYSTDGSGEPTNLMRSRKAD